MGVIGAMVLGAYLAAPFPVTDLGDYITSPFPVTDLGDYITSPFPVTDLGDYSTAPMHPYEGFLVPFLDILPSSDFGMRWHPILNARRFHAGVDYPAAKGTPVRATREGVVAFRGLAGDYGRLVRLTHGQGWETRYAHLKRWSPGLHVGVTIHVGQIIGYVGESGRATGPHLHYEVLLYGRPLDPSNL